MEKLNLSLGNIKLKATDKAKFLIWNIPSKVTCPNSTPLCRKYCYASKSEIRFPKALASRERNLEATKNINFVENMIYTIDSYLNKKSFIGKKVYFRIHESGDFYNESYFINWLKIANHYRTTENIVFLAYTKSFSFVKDWIDFIPSNLIIRASIWDDTTKADKDLIEALNLPYFTAYPKGQLPMICYNCIGDCSKCKVCYTPIIHVACEIH